MGKLGRGRIIQHRVGKPGDLGCGTGGRTQILMDTSPMTWRTSLGESKMVSIGEAFRPGLSIGQMPFPKYAYRNPESQGTAGFWQLV